MRLVDHRTVARSVTLLLSVALLIGWPSGVAAQGPNLLANPGFEYPFHASLPGKDNCFIAHGWTGWFLNGTPEETNQGFLRAPEYKAATRHDAPFNRVRNGEAAQQWFGSFSTFRGGVYQQVGNVTPGARYRFEAWAMVWSCHFSSEKDAGNCADARSGNPSPMRVRIGIDPTGGTDPFSGAIVWSGIYEPVDNWQQLQVEATAQGNRVTVFVYSDPEYRNRNNNVYVDDASLVMVSAPPTPRPQPTNTPRPTAAPTDTPEPTATPTPEATETPLPTPTPETGSLRALSFEDRNGNGLRDAGEPLIAGARIQVLDMAGAAIAAQTSDGAGPVVFEGLAPGNYRVVEAHPAGYESTSVDQWAVALVAGAEVEVLFGNRPLPTATPQPSATPSLAPSPTAAATAQPVATATPAPVPAPRGGLGQWLYSVSGVILVVLAIGALVLVQRRRL